MYEQKPAIGKVNITNNEWIGSTGKQVRTVDSTNQIYVQKLQLNLLSFGCQLSSFLRLLEWSDPSLFFDLCEVSYRLD